MVETDGVLPTTFDADKSPAPSCKLISHEEPLKPSVQKHLPLWQRPLLLQSNVHCNAFSIFFAQSAPSCASSHSHCPKLQTPCPVHGESFTDGHCVSVPQSLPSKPLLQKHLPNLQRKNLQI